MDSPHQKKTSPSGPENHGVYLCHRCGWPFPNPHPSARHRRAHKRICGTVEGYKLTDSEGHAHLAVSDDEHSDEDRHNSGPNMEKSSSGKQFTSGGVGERSNRSEDDFFSDAVADFSDSGSNSGFEGHLEGVRELDKNVEKIVDGDLDSSQSPKVNANADTAHPPNSPTDTCQVKKNPEVLEGATNQLGDTTTVQQAVSSCSDSMENDVKGNEESDVDKIFLDDVAFSSINAASKASEADSKLLVMVEKTSDPVIADGIVQPKKDQSDGLEPKISKDDSGEAESVEHTEAFGNTVQFEEVSRQDRDFGMHGHLVEVCNTKEERNEDMHVLLVANDLALVDNPEIMIEDFKDHNGVKPNIPLTLGSGEVTKSLEDGNKDTVCESDSSSYSSKPGERSNISSADMNGLEENPKQEDGGNHHTIEVPGEGKADILKVEVMSSDDVGSSGVEDPLGTIRTEADKIQTNHCLEGLHPQYSYCDSSRNIPLESNKTDLSDTIDTVAPVDGTNLSVKKPPEFLDNISTSEDQVFNSLGQDDSGSREMTGNEFFDISGSGSREAMAEKKCAMNLKTCLESESQFSESQDVTDDGVAKFARNFQEAESNYFDRVSDSSKDGIGTTDLGNDEDCKAIKKLESNDSEVPVESVGAVNTADELNCAGDVEVLHRNSGDFNLKEPEALPVDSEFITKSFDNVEDNQGRNADGADSGVSSDILGDGDNNLPKQHVGVSAVDILVASSCQADNNVEDNQGRNTGGGDSGVSSDILGDGDNNLTKQHGGVSAVDISVDSRSQTDRLEAIKKLENNDDSEVPVECVGAVSTAAELNRAGDIEVLHRNSGDFNLKEPEALPVDSEFITKSFDNVEDNQGRNAGGGDSGVSSDILGDGDNNLPKQHVGVSAVDISVASSSQADNNVEDNQGRNTGGGDSGVSSDILGDGDNNLSKQHGGVSAVDISVDSRSQTDSLEAIKKLENNDDSEVPVECVGAVSTAAELNRAGDIEVLHRNSRDFNLKEREPLPVDSEFITKSSDNVEDNQGRNASGGASGVSSDLLGEGDDNLTKQHVGVSALDISVDSSSQTDSLEGNWGSVSVLSIQSDAPAAVDAEALRSEKGNLEKPKPASKGHHSENSDAFEAPSFMTLVESGSEIDQKVASSEIHLQDAQRSRSEALQAGWFPSLTNVVNDSQGRKKNEEIIAKVTNWSTGKQHIPLKNLLGEANHETKPKSPNTRPSPTVIQNDETAARNNGVSAPKPTTVHTILRPEASTDRAAGKAWNSPARYPTDNKKEKRKIKGKPYWVPFVCCSSVN
ncbi:uncharacterized protein LOC132274766 isoform X2 [Cornus florida]|uniref:uncharacterized protein LOC132274766 isoform X2 n=1 Tax=Cornus florida TaxID=4283 RepID=UPI002897FABD|nr:uncharacterized protein LOC132274766 isoform X2 [Cornus florida]